MTLLKQGRYEHHPHKVTLDFASSWKGLPYTMDFSSQNIAQAPDKLVPKALTIGMRGLSGLKR